MKKDVLQPKNFVMLTIAGLINAFGVACFLYPVNLGSQVLPCCWRR